MVLGGARTLTLITFPMAVIIALPTLTKKSSQSDLLNTSLTNNKIFLNGSSKHPGGPLANDVFIGNTTELSSTVIHDAEHALRSWLNSHRRKRCNSSKIHRKPGEVQYFTTGTANNGNIEYLLQVAYGKEFFFARILQNFLRNQTRFQPSVRVEKVIPAPCEHAKKDRLAITSPGMK